MTSYIERRSEAYLSGDERTIRNFFLSEGIRQLPPKDELWRCIYVAVLRIVSHLPPDAIWSEIEDLVEEDAEEELVNNPLGSYTWEELARRAVICSEVQSITPLPREAAYMRLSTGQKTKIPYYFYGKTPDVAPPRAK